jgi:hypothetical protein
MEQRSSVEHGKVNRLVVLADGEVGRRALPLAPQSAGDGYSAASAR